MEAAIRTLVPAGGRLLVPSTGAYAGRLQKLAAEAGRVAVPLYVGVRDRVDPRPWPVSYTHLDVYKRQGSTGPT